jgi:fucose permease
MVVGLGCAPIYPCIIHSTPGRFGEDRSQAIVGVQMAAAYCGTLFMPPLFGMLSERISMGIFPVYLLLILALMVLTHERVVRLHEKV